MEYLERAFDDAKYGRASEHPYAEVMFPTAHEPRARARGQAHHDGVHAVRPVRAREGSWETEREAYARRVIDGSRGSRPTSRPRSSTSRCWTPRDLEARFGLLGGNIMQGEIVARSALLLPPDPVLRRLPHAGREPLPLRRRHAPRRWRDGRARAQRVDASCGPEAQPERRAPPRHREGPMNRADLGACVRGAGR